MLGPAGIVPKQDNLVTRPLEIHRQHAVELKYKVIVLKSIKTIYPQMTEIKMWAFSIHSLWTFITLTLSQLREMETTLGMLISK